jgi:hypothetical protein
MSSPPVLALCLLACACATKRAEPLVDCTVRYASTSQQVRARPEKQPYEVQAVDIAERFAFKAVFRDSPRASASISLYVYAHEANGDELLQEVKYLPPYPAVPANAESYGFTGHQFVYSRDGRELEYWCRLGSP